MLPLSLFFSLGFSRVLNEGACDLDCINSKLVHACVRMNGAGPFIHDPLDSVSAAAALGAASEAGIHLAHTGPSRLFYDH
jgi:hypothetical protein